MRQVEITTLRENNVSIANQTFDTTCLGGSQEPYDTKPAFVEAKRSSKNALLLLSVRHIRKVVKKDGRGTRDPAGGYARLAGTVGDVGVRERISMFLYGASSVLDDQVSPTA